ncbi:hypothetical protein EG329_002320 [Mollisiaceae sp. DMI_Dod_QoI]|nr:hypothetical protein EG329_002320 [Helotiales sp. DMI_Dod_QoI]
MSISPNDSDLMEKGEAGELKEAAALEKSVAPSSPSTARSTKGLLWSRSNSEKQLTTPWMGSLRKGLSSRTQQLFQCAARRDGRETIVRNLEECAEGYPRLAAFLDSDENFMLYRRFGFLQARILLYKQDELRELEEELDGMDNRDAKTRARKLKSRERDDAQCEDRKILIAKITRTFNEYAELLKSAHDLAAFNRAPERDYESVSRYFNMTDPLCNKESYIYRKEDIISIKPGRENAWLDAIVERILQKISCPLIRGLFCSKDLRRKTDPKDSKIILYSRTRINMVVSLIITTVILALLIIPVYLLWHLTRSGDFNTTTTAIIIGLLLVFTLIFSATLSLFTRAKRHEILAAAAGYCAVLVVFIGNIGQLVSPTS